VQLRLALPPRVDSPLSRLDPRWRLAGLVVCLVALAAVRSPPACLAGFALALSLALAARPPLPWLRGRLLFVGVVVAVFALPIPLFGGAAWAEGFALAGALVAKAMGVFLVSSALLVSGSLESTLAASGSLGVPRLFARLAQMSLRYLFLLGEELARLRVALRVRGFRNRATAHSYRTVAAASGMLLVRGGARADRVAQAMRCRGFDGTFRTLEKGTTTVRDVAFLLATLTLAAALVWLDRVTREGTP
jgi:cobalt/nickel transport system permease protein